MSRMPWSHNGPLWNALRQDAPQIWAKRAVSIQPQAASGGASSPRGACSIARQQARDSQRSWSSPSSQRRCPSPVPAAGRIGLEGGTGEGEHRRGLASLFQHRAVHVPPACLTGGQCSSPETDTRCPRAPAPPQSPSPALCCGPSCCCLLVQGLDHLLLSRDLGDAGLWARRSHGGGRTASVLISCGGATAGHVVPPVVG